MAKKRAPKKVEPKKRAANYKNVRIRLNKAKVIAAIKDSGGVMKVVADRLGVNWHTADSYIKKHKEFEKLLEIELNLYLDVATSHLLNNVNAGKEWAIKYFLDRKGESRGFSPKTDITSKNEKINSGTVIILPDNGRGEKDKS